jgi:hypothetical protein
MTYTGSCLCGGITLRIDGDMGQSQVCYCVQCRKSQGGPLATNVPVPVTAFQLRDDTNLLRSFESSPGKHRAFCGRCVSPVLSRRDTVPGLVRIRAGLVNEPVNSGLAWHAFFGSKCDWWPIQGALPQYDKGYAPPGGS